MFINKVFLFLFIIFALTIVTSSNAFAQTSENNSSPSGSINYNLAYPGILPNHPLYKLKVLRNKITERLIKDPSKKIDFYLLQADKGFFAVLLLMDKNKVELAKETALKGEHNFTKLVDEFRLKNKKPNNDLYQRLKKASLKHQEVLRSVINRVDKNDKITFENVLYFSKTNLEELDKMQNNKKLIK